MSDRRNSPSPAEPPRERTPSTHATPPAALRRRGIQTASQPEKPVAAGGALWKWFGRDLKREFYS